MKELIGKDISEGTYKRYLVTLGKIKRFLKQKYKKSDVLLCDLKYQFISDFNFFLKKTDGLDHNTCIVYLKKLKKIINMSVKNEWLIRNPFLGYKCVSKPVERAALAEAELRLLRDKAFHLIDWKR